MLARAWQKLQQRNNTMKIKTFTDLVFTDHPNVANGVQAKLDVGNRVEISVVSMKNNPPLYGSLYGDASNGTYEVAVFYLGSMLPLTPCDDVIGWQTKDEISELMARFQGDAVDVLNEIAELSTTKEIEL